ncbi:ankyrin-2 isoform X2 [Odontomachus brunneus]|uniref:ankyrin-2 isoform X2 n=1 Tax=Odontomachus brunneus TaxID=486640 RepID=UPI0013F1D54B|nr:ankyrin-2 isoform X2 [Odontomachus brunneus]
MVTDNITQADDTTAFLRAARSGNLEKVVEFLDTDLDINTANSNGLNALHLASKDGHIEIVTELLKRGAKVDAATKKGNTALHIASLAGQCEIVGILIQYGAAVNIQSQNGFTPLYMAAQENHDEVVKFLLSNGANQSLATEDGFTPLAVAMQQGHDKVVSVLLENDSKGKVRLPALHIAAKKDDCKAADLLLQNDHKPDVTSKSGFTPLHIAAHYGNEEVGRLLIKRGADINYLAKHNISPLHVAAKWGKNNMVKVLLENSAQIDGKTRDGLTPLHCAARSGHEQVVSTLLENSAPISARTKNGLAPLHMASQGDHVDAARVLLYHRAPVDEVTIDYLTSLHVAAHCGHVRVAKLLLDRKADPNARALNGFTPLHIACKKNRIKVVELLLKHGASIESTTESGLTSLHVASFMGCMNIVIFLLQHEANPDVPTVRGETPLHLAARANQTDIIRILLRNGAKVDARTREQQTPLHIASRLGNIDIVMLLLQHGAAVDTATKDMYTALHIAAKEGQEEVAAILVENNASLKAATKNGFTPLHIAAKYGNMNVANILLQKESKLDVQGKNDISPLHLACHYDHPNVANLLLEKGASPHLASQNGHTPLHIAARKNQMDIASTLLENGANANAESKAGFTPLHLSSQKGHYDMTNLLIEHGANPNHKAKNGLTALHLCAQEDFIRVASILVKNGADVESQTETGYRPIHVAAYFGNLSMIRFLLKHNAEIDVRTNQNYTPLHQAAQQGHAHIVTALLEGNASHKARTNDGLTALNIAQKLGYISVMEVLKGLPYDSMTPDNKNWEEKYKVIAPESLQETSFMSDSDDEGGSDALISEQPYRYLTADLMKSLRDDSLPIDVTRDDPIHRQVTKEEKQEFTQSNNYCLAENFDSTDGLNLGRLHFRSFLVSFLVDARGGAMKGCRHSGVRIIVPPRRATMPIRVTCRLVKPNKVTNPPPLMEGEALATRIIEMGPVGATFLGPVLIDIPHFASVRGKEREIIILRSENGETWREHDNIVDNDDTLLNTPYDPQMNATHSGRITRIITTDFPQYFAIVTRIKQEVHVIGAEGGILISSVANHVQAVFPAGALTKKIKVGLQAHVIPAELTAKLLGNCVAVSPVITIEPRRRKFHKPITLTIPVPQAANKGMINQYGGETPTLRLLCSIAGGTNEAQWEDVTGSTPLTFMNDRVSFTTTVSARFWLMDCRNIVAVPKMATELYEESLYVPYITNFIIYSKRMDVLEATLRILCMTDGKEGMHTLERQEEFLEIVKSRDVEALDGKDLYIEFSGNLVPVTKSGVQLKFTFKAFRQNRLSFHVKVKDPLLDPVARMLFMREPKVAKGEPAQQPICVLNIVLPEIITKEKIQKKLKGYKDSNIINQKLDYYKSKYKTEQMEKSDKPKETSPEKKFITDTLQKEQTDAATIHESLAQKAACPLESVDASYPNKVGVDQELDLSPELEKQTYSEKRKFWEDISRKRASYQRSESEVSRASQLTINESDSESCLPNVVSEEDGTTEGISDVIRSETIEDINVPDISECSVAEKAHYFEEQIQKEMAKGTPRLSQESIKSEKDRLFRGKSIEDQKTRPEKSTLEMTKEKMEIEEKHVAEAREIEKILKTTEDIKWTKEARRESKDIDKKEKDMDEGKELREEVQKIIAQPVMEICKELLNKERQLTEEAEMRRIKTREVEKEATDEEPKKMTEMFAKVEERVKPERMKEKVLLRAEKSQEETDVIRREAVRDIEETEKVEQIMEVKTISDETKAREVKREVKEEFSRPMKTLEGTTMTTTIKEELTKRIPEKLELAEDVTKLKRYTEETHILSTAPEISKLAEATTVITEEFAMQRKPDVSTDVVQETKEEQRPETPTSKEVIKEKSSGRRIITEETTIIYKVQKDGTLVQEQIMKSVQIEGADGQPVTQVPEVSMEMKVLDKDITDTAYEVQMTGNVERLRTEIKTETVPLDVKKEIEQFLEGEKRMVEEEAEMTEERKPVKEEIKIKEVSESQQKVEEIVIKQADDTTFERKPVVEAEIKQLKKESRIPISAAMAEKDKSQKEGKTKTSPEKPEEKPTKSPVTEREKDIASPLGKKKEFESRIPKRIMESTTMKEKDAKKDLPGRKDSETITITEKKSSEEVTSRHEERLTTKSKMQTFSKTFTDTQDAFKMFEDMSAMKDKDFATVTSKIDTKATSKVEKKEVVSSEISSGADKFITHEEKERVERKKSSESKVTKESPAETIEEKKSKSEEVDKTTVQKMLMNVTEGKEVIDASASESKVESKKEGLFKSLEDKEGIAMQESGTTRVRESDVDVAIRIKRDDTKKVEDTKESPKAAAEEIDLGKIEMLAQGQSYKESSESFKVEQFIPSQKTQDEARKDEVFASKKDPESLEKKQQIVAKKMEARNIAEDLIQSIESEIEKRSSMSGLKAQMLSREYIDQLVSESSDTDHEKLADDLTKKFESILKKSLDEQTVEGKVGHPILSKTSVHEETFEKGSTRDSISEDLTKDEESSPHDREESLQSSSQARLQDRDITMSPSSISEQIDLEGTIDVDTNELEDISKPISSLQSEKLRSDRSSGHIDPLQRDLYSDTSLSKDKIVSELSGARVLEILEPGGDSRQDSVDVPSLELDEHKFSEQTSRDVASLHESAAMDSLDKIVQERDMTVSPSTVSEDVNVDYPLVHEQAIAPLREYDAGARRADSFEIESPPLVSPRTKLVHDLDIKQVNWMIGDEKIVITETLQPSEAFNQELEEYERRARTSSQDESVDLEQESVTKSSEDISVIESVKESIAGGDAASAIIMTTTTKTSKFTVIPVTEPDLDSELIEDKLDVTCQELVDTLQREYDAKTPTDEYTAGVRQAIPREDFDLEASITEAVTEVVPVKEEEVKDLITEPVAAEIMTSEKQDVSMTRIETVEPTDVSKVTVTKAEEESARRIPEETQKQPKVDESDETGKQKEVTREEAKEAVEAQKDTTKEESDLSKSAKVDDVLKEWTESYRPKMRSEEYKRHMEKSSEKHDRPGKSTTAPTDTCAFKIKKDDLQSVDLSARYAITVLDQVVKKEIAEVKESLEAAKQDLIEELSENSETMIQIKDSPSEFQFKLQPESIPNDLPFLYRPPSIEHVPAEPEPVTEVAATRSESSVAKSPEVDESTVEQVKETVVEDELIAQAAATDEDKSAAIAQAPEIDIEKHEIETVIAVQDESKEDEEDDHPSPLPASISGSDVDNRDDSYSLAPPYPAPRRRQKPARISKRVKTSESEAGSSSGESSNYQSCDYESGSRPSSSDIEALQSAGVQSGTASEYETAMMSIEQSASRPTSQEYQTAASTLSSRESMKSLNSLSSGHLGSIDSTSELSETLVPSDVDADKDEIDENLESALDAEQEAEASDSSGSDIPMDEAMDKIDSHIPCRMKRSSEMIFQQIMDDSMSMETESMEEALEEDARVMDSATSAFMDAPGALQSVDIMTSRVTEDGVQSVCTQVISTRVTRPSDSEDLEEEPERTEKSAERDVETTDAETAENLEQKSGDEVGEDGIEPVAQTSVHSMLQQASMSLSSASGMSFDTVIEKDKSERHSHSPDSDSFELVDKPDIIDDFVVIEEVGREAEEFDSEGKSIRISSIPQVTNKNYDRDLENLIAENKEDTQVSTSQASKNNELFDFESEESPPQASNDEQYSQSYSDEEQYEGKKWIEMQFHSDARVYDIEYDRGPLEDIKEEEVTDFEAGSSRFGSLGSHKESIGSVGSMRGSFGSTPEYDVLAGKKYFSKPTDDTVSLTSLQEFEHLESTVAAENSRRLQCGSQDSINNGSLPRRYMTGRSGHGDDVSLSSLKDFEGLERACREAHLIELRAREEEDLLEHESPENKYKMENLPRSRTETSAAGSFNPSTSGSDDYEKRIKEIDEIIRIAQSNVERLDRQDDTTEDISQIEITDTERVVAQPTSQTLPEEMEPEVEEREEEEQARAQKESNVMETSTDSLELEDNAEKKYHPLCRSSDSLEMKTTLDFPSLSSDSLNNVRDTRETPLDAASGNQFGGNGRRISSDSLDMPLLEQQDVGASGRRSSDSDGRHADDVPVDSSAERTPSTETHARNGKTKTSPSSGT